MIYNRHAQIAIRSIRFRSKAELSAASRVSAPYITELEKGDKTTPSEKSIRAIADALDVPPEALYVSTASIRKWVIEHKDEVADWLGISELLAS